MTAREAACGWLRALHSARGRGCRAGDAARRARRAPPPPAETCQLSSTPLTVAPNSTASPAAAAAAAPPPSPQPPGRHHAIAARWWSGRDALLTAALGLPLPPPEPGGVASRLSRRTESWQPRAFFTAVANRAGHRHAQLTQPLATSSIPSKQMPPHARAAQTLCRSVATHRARDQLQDGGLCHRRESLLGNEPNAEPLRRTWAHAPPGCRRNAAVGVATLAVGGGEDAGGHRLAVNTGP